MGNIGAFIIRTGFGTHYAVIMIRNAQNILYLFRLL